MRRLALAVLISATLPLTVQTATAHTPDVTIAGFQYAASYQFETAPSTTGYLGQPFGPTEIDGEITADEAIGSIVNQDAVPHTFTEATTSCLNNGSCYDARFNVALGGRAAASPAAMETLNAVFAKDLLEKGGPQNYLVMCTVHRWMRARLTVTG